MLTTVCLYFISPHSCAYSKSVKLPLLCSPCIIMSINSDRSLINPQAPNSCLTFYWFQFQFISSHMSSKWDIGKQVCLYLYHMSTHSRGINIKKMLRLSSHYFVKKNTPKKKSDAGCSFHECLLVKIVWIDLCKTKQETKINFDLER